MKKITIAILTSFISLSGFTQNSPEELFEMLRKNDSLLFTVGFNTCKMAPFEELISEDFEFYHDRSGVETSKSNFIEQFKNGICGSDSFSSRRELVDGSLEVFPMVNNGKLYGALQTGVHRFFETRKGEGETAGSIAKFSHLWILEEDGVWRITRVLSYDHQMPN